jgi:pantetheine-phosphate adenylyltransferase
MKIAVYAGSFDPITNGHLNLIERCVKIFDKIIVAIAKNPSKKMCFSVEDRLYMIKESVKNYKNVQVDAFDGLLVEYMKMKNAQILIRGLRAVSDFEYEFQMAHMNHKLFPEMETFFMMTGTDQFYISSHIVREAASFGGDIRGLAPEIVIEMLRKKFGK